MSKSNINIPIKQLVKPVSHAEYVEQQQYLFKVIFSDRRACENIEQHVHNVKRALDVSQELCSMRCDTLSADDQENAWRTLALAARYFEQLLMLLTDKPGPFNSIKEVSMIRGLPPVMSRKTEVAQ
ncbi:MAG: hypothetical protein OEY58_19360 [Gammaproteobacteria bacterium]|nr:hypothetical protein [Gammaproteobacteria bacterium]